MAGFAGIRGGDALERGCAAPPCQMEAESGGGIAPLALAREIDDERGKGGACGWRIAA